MAAPPDTKRGATYEDLLRVPDTMVAEIVDGELFASPRPRPRHSAAASALGGDLNPPAPGTPPKGRAFYMVDVENGAILFKISQGLDGGGGNVSFAPMPAPPAATDYNDDGYLDVAYIGDVNGHMWRIDLTPDPTSSRGLYNSGDRQLHGYQPFLLYDGCGAATGSCPNRFAPIFTDPGIVFLGGSASPPSLGIAFGTGNRADLVNPKPLSDPRSLADSFYYVVDTGQSATTFVRSDLRDISPAAGLGPCPLPPAACDNGSGNPAAGFVLDFATVKETTTSSVFSTQGYLSLVTFTADSPSPCANNGSSFRYVFFFLTGQGKYGTTGTYADYQQGLGSGLAAVSQSTSPQGDIIDTVLFSGGAVRQDPTPGSVRTIEQNWKEQQ